MDTSNAHERISQLEHQNALLVEELTVLRSNPRPDADVLAPSHPAVLQAQQLTLALRRLSDKLSLTEESLSTRTTELAHALSEGTKARHAMEGAYELSARTRGREEEGKVRERELERKVRAAEEERKMSDLVVNEYADLVRSLEGRPHSKTHSRTPSGIADEPPSNTPTLVTSPSASSITLVDGLSQGKLGLQKLLSEFSSETERLQAHISSLHGELETLESKLEAEKKGSEHDRVNLAMAQFELEKLKIDDNTAAKMVSRYMHVMPHLLLYRLYPNTYIAGNSRSHLQTPFRLPSSLLRPDMLPP